MAYQVLARKWRPQRFSEVVGQEHITRTLKNAILNNRIGQAYLFVGSRGIGKTTTARIFAKALNCLHPLPDGEPCCECENCRQIVAGNSLDVLEIDGASHNKVEDIRVIRDNVQYAPSSGKYKIYIIDEVHMLTTQAWNALLKTLEEPPAHVKFLFATTEPHKVLPTIVSRCQRFDMKRISVSDIAKRLSWIAEKEHLYMADDALYAIARAADGGMRDAQSIMDQMIAFCGGQKEEETIREQDVIQVFGLASSVELRAIAAAIFQNNLDDALRVVQKLADGGRDLERLYADLMEYLRNLMIAGVCRDPANLLEAEESDVADMRNIASAVPPRMVQDALQLLIAQEERFRLALNKRIYFEATLAKVMLEIHAVALDDILTHLHRMAGLLPPDTMPEKRESINFPVPVERATAEGKEQSSVTQDDAIVKEMPEEKGQSPVIQNGAVAREMETAKPIAESLWDFVGENAEAPEIEGGQMSVSRETVQFVSMVKPVEFPKQPEEKTEPASTGEPEKISGKQEEKAETATVPEPAPVAENSAATAEPEKMSGKQEEKAETATVPEPAPVAEIPAATAEPEKMSGKPEEKAETATVPEPAPVAEIPAATAEPEETSGKPEEKTEPATVPEPAPVAENPAATAEQASVTPMMFSGASAGGNDVLVCEDETADASFLGEDSGEEDAGETPIDGAQAAMRLPEEAQNRLADALDRARQERLAEVISQAQAISLSSRGLFLKVRSYMLDEETRALIDSNATRAILAQHMHALSLPGKVEFEIEAREESNGKNRKRYRSASYLESQRIGQDPLVQKLTQALGMEMADAWMPDTGDGER